MCLPCRQRRVGETRRQPAAPLRRRYRPEYPPTIAQHLLGGLCQPPWLLLSELHHDSYDPDVAVDQKTSFATMLRRFASCPVSLSHKAFTQSFIATLDWTTTIIDGTPQIHCSDLELLPCATTSMTHSCHCLTSLHGSKGEWVDQRRIPGVRTSSSKKDSAEKRLENG